MLILVEDISFALHAGITLRFELGIKLIMKLGEQSFALGFIGDVRDEIRVLLQIIKLKPRTKSEAQLPEMIVLIFAMGIDEQALRGPGITIHVTRLGVATRPARGFKVFDQERILLDDGPDGIAPVVGPPHIGAFLAHQNVIARGIHLPCFLGEKDVGQAASRRRCHT